MIEIKVEKKGSKYQRVKILGHAMYDDYGKDIVCSAVSSIVITTVNGILSLEKGSLDYIVSKKGMDIRVKPESRQAQVLIRNMINLLHELEVSYPSNIQIK